MMIPKLQDSKQRRMRRPKMSAEQVQKELYLELRELQWLLAVAGHLSDMDGVIDVATVNAPEGFQW